MTLPPTLGIGLHHLRQEAGFPDHQLIGQQHRERFVTDYLTRTPYRVAKPQRLLLADIDRAEPGR